MGDPAKRRATYDNVLAAPERGERGLWLRAGTWTGEALVRAEPFDAVELELAALWTE
jgi:hypothetical protein